MNVFSYYDNDFPGEHFIYPNRLDICAFIQLEKFKEICIKIFMEYYGLAVGYAINNIDNNTDMFYGLSQYNSFVHELPFLSRSSLLPWTNGNKAKSHNDLLKFP